MRNNKIAIIGGGLTGLVLAYRLGLNGRDVTIFEKEDSVGGLASSFQIASSNLEKCYHHIFRTDQDFIKLALELNIKINWLESTMSVFSGGRFHPFSTPLDLLRFGDIPFLDRIRTGLVTLYLQRCKNWMQFENIKAVDWISNYFGKSSYKTIWKPLLKSKFGAHYNKISMAWFWARMNVRSNSRKGIFSKEYLGYPEGGFESLIDALHNKLTDQKIKIQTNTSIENISKNSKGQILLKTQNNIQPFDKVIATIPSPIFANMLDTKIIDNNYQDILYETQYLGAICMTFSTKQNLSDYYWHNLNGNRLPFLIFVNHTKLVDKSFYNNENIYYLGGYYQKDHEFFSIKEEQLKKLWLLELTRIIPNLDINQIQESFVFKFRYAQHIVDTDYRQKIPNYQTPVKNLYLANFSQIYPEDRGTNYAIKEAEKIYKIINNENC